LPGSDHGKTNLTAIAPQRLIAQTMDLQHEAL
jgi:hypothetical protein